MGHGLRARSPWPILFFQEFRTDAGPAVHSLDRDPGRRTAFMAEAPLRSVARQLRSLAEGPAERDESDERLLGRFAAGRDEAAFAELVRRHGPLVFRVCRHVL